ncbi:MAG: DUF3857 and transglutaminase domain-containing protein [Chlorobi bacterium]|nr:DUF3857 and transglutaminase domain-containing protein [Chlorobiota bacterium]
MKTRLLFGWIIGFLWGTAGTFAQLPLEADTLFPQADAVVLEHHTEVDWAPRKMTVRRKFRVLIRRRDGDRLARVVLFYNPRVKIKKVNLVFYHRNSKRRIPLKDFDDLAASGTHTLYTDDRVKYYRYTPPDYPYLMELETEIVSENTAFIPSWHPYARSRFPVVSSEYVLNFPPEDSIHFSIHIPSSFTVTQTREPGRVKLALRNAPPMPPEPYGLPPHKRLPRANFRPAEFYLAGLHGTARTWTDFGRWAYNTLFDPPSEPTEEIARIARQLTRPYSRTEDKVRAIYDYVQKNMRYVSIQVDLGGWKPMPAAEVHRLKYGDCKGLTAYTRALLKAAGIPSYVTLVYAHSSYPRDVNERLPGFQGNHTILCVPSEKDTIWLETTSAYLPAGYLGDFTSDRKVIVIEPDGARIVRTPSLKTENNREETRAVWHISEDLSARGRVHIHSQGLEMENRMARFYKLKPDDRLRAYMEFYDLPGLKISNIRQKRDTLRPVFDEDFQAELPRILRRAGNSYLLTPLLARSPEIPPKDEERRDSVYIPWGRVRMLTETYRLPRDWKIEFLPAPVELETPFGRYTRKFTYHPDGKIIFERSLLLRPGMFPPSMYEDFRRFLKKIRKEDRNPVIIKPLSP